MSDNVDINVRSGYDSLLTEIAQYVSNYDVNSDYDHDNNNDISGHISMI